MGRKRSRSPSPNPVSNGGLTGDRLARLYHLVRILGKGPQSRAVLTRRLKLDVRGFYRDLEALRSTGVEVTLESGRYNLVQSLAAALALLPLPDPHLTYGEAQTLAKGRTAAHRKLKTYLDRLTR